VAWFDPVPSRAAVRCANR